ncbi:MAG: SpoIID/LytB domain-containing protein [Acidobacteria bacterium]|nr:SpoIID/LytB domain-containing protein [Acidobacteriota bacterium]
MEHRKQPEALKAQAIVSRTFGLKNLGRHVGEGYDFCSTTHCQRFIPATGASFQISKRAVESTRGQVLADSSGKYVDAYFHAACGGMTANIEDLWGIAAPEYLQGVRDEYCKLMPHRNWSARIPANRLAQAMRSDKRTDIGRVLKSIKVSKYDRTGRAQWIWIEGDKIKAVRGWEFKIVAGRKLGWQLIKSSRFNVSRSGDDFIFTGTGFGHGLGLCQEGTHVMAARGLDYRRILKFYFPHTGLKTVNDSELVQVDFRPNQQTFTGDHFRLIAGRGTDQKALARAMSIFEAARKDLLLRLESAALNVDESRPYEVIIHSSTSGFISATGQSGWVSGVTRGRRIELQPLTLLEKRGILETSLRHETAHAIIERLGGGSAPRWLAEGLAIHFAGEAPGLSKTRTLPLLSRDELERRLAKPASAQVSRELYKAAYLEVRRLIASQGEPAAWRLAARYFNSSRS